MDQESISDMIDKVEEKKCEELKKEMKDMKEENERLKKECEELKKYENVINCIKGHNGGKCMISDFLPIDTIPDDIKSKLSIFNKNINELLPIVLKVPYKNGKPCNNQSLGNQIPNKLKEYISNEIHLSELLKFHKMKLSGYPDEKVTIECIDIPFPFLWEWKTMNSNDGSGVRIVISKFPNKRIPKTFIDCDKKYHLWVCLEYEKVEDNETNITQATISKINIYCISPNTVLNTKFELSTTVQLIKCEIDEGHIILL